MDLSKILEGIKLSPKYLLPIALASGFLLFGPPNYIAVLGLDAFVFSYRTWIGLILLLSSTLLLSHLLYGSWHWVSRQLQDLRFKSSGRKRLANLTREEKETLREFILKQTRTQRLDFTSGVVTGLEHDKIIYQAAGVGSVMGFDYNIQPWAWDYLNKNKRLLED